MNFGVPDVLRGFRCKCGASANRMRLWYRDSYRPKEFACELCGRIYVRTKFVGKYVEKETEK